MQFQNSVEPNKTRRALLLSTVKKVLQHCSSGNSYSKFSTETSSGNEKTDVKASLVNGGFSEY